MEYIAYAYNIYAQMIYFLHTIKKRYVRQIYICYCLWLFYCVFILNKCGEFFPNEYVIYSNASCSGLHLLQICPKCFSVQLGLANQECYTQATAATQYLNIRYVSLNQGATGINKAQELSHSPFIVSYYSSSAHRCHYIVSLYCHKQLKGSYQGQCIRLSRACWENCTRCVLIQERVKTRQKGKNKEPENSDKRTWDGRTKTYS